NFNNQSYFTKVFKKFTEVTPKQYRKQYTIY
ncbi:helix-turn-helix transcriptional regulator, partial [Bacillus wiedmannii]